MTAFDDAMDGIPESAADPRKSPVVESEARKDEEYEPEGLLALVEQRKFEHSVQVRITAAGIAAQIPWNPTEPVSDELITKRLTLVYNWLMQENIPSTD